MTFRKPDDVLGLHPCGQQPARGIHVATDPDRLLVGERHQDHLRRVERPAVISGDVVLVGDVVDDQQVKVAARQFGANGGKSGAVFAERKRRLDQIESSYSIVSECVYLTPALVNGLKLDHFELSSPAGFLTQSSKWSAVLYLEKTNVALS